MADSKLRLQITTALDAAGIKATKEQIDGLEKQLAKTNHTGADGLTNLEKKIGKIKGPLGQVQDLFGGLAAKIAAAVGAFSLGFEIGEKIQGWADKILGLKEPVEELKKANRELAKEQERAASAIDSRIARVESSSGASIAKIDAETQKVNTLRDAWNKVWKAKSDYHNAGRDVEIQQLERQRFEDVVQLQNAGDFEAAEQSNKVYDILVKQVEAKKQLEAFDRETLAAEQDLSAEEEKRLSFSNKLFELDGKLRDLRQQAERVENTATSSKQYESQMRRIQGLIAATERQIAQTETAQDAYESGFQAKRIGLATRARQRATLESQLSLSVDQSAWAYDQSLESQGNLLGLSFTQEFKDSMLEASKQSYDNLAKAIQDGVAKGIGELMEAK